MTRRYRTRLTSATDAVATNMIAVVLAVFPVSDANSGECYRYAIDITDGPCATGYAQPRDIDQSGLVVGYIVCGVLGGEVPGRWEGESFTPLPMPPRFPNGRAMRLNARGEIVGYMNDENRNWSLRAFRYAAGMVFDLGLISGATFSYASGINDSGIICGSSGDGGDGVPPEQSVLWDPARGWAMEIVTLTIPPPHRANGINAGGAICGFAGGGAYWWHNGVTVDLGIPEGYTYAEAFAINDSNVVVGYARKPGFPSSKRVACIWDERGTTLLPILPGYVSAIALDIANDGTVVGYCLPELPAVVYKACLWRDGEVHALIDLVDMREASDNLRIDVAWGISDNGLIAADGTLLDTNPNEAIAVRLTPIAPIAGDLDCDHDVDSADLGILLGAWGTCNAESCPSDLDGSGATNASDLGMLLGAWTG